MRPPSRPARRSPRVTWPDFVGHLLFVQDNQHPAAHGWRDPSPNPFVLRPDQAWKHRCTHPWLHLWPKRLTGAFQTTTCDTISAQAIGCVSIAKTHDAPAVWEVSGFDMVVMSFRFDGHVSDVYCVWPSYDAPTGEKITSRSEVTDPSASVASPAPDAMPSPRGQSQSRRKHFHFMLVKAPWGLMPHQRHALHGWLGHGSARGARHTIRARSRGVHGPEAGLRFLLDPPRSETPQRRRLLFVPRNFLDTANGR